MATQSRIASQQIFGMGCARPQPSGFLGESYKSSADYQSYQHRITGLSHSGAILNSTTLHDGPVEPGGGTVRPSPS